METQMKPIDLTKIMLLLKPDVLNRLIAALEAVMDSGNGEVVVAIKQGNPIFIKTAVTESCQR